MNSDRYFSHLVRVALLLVALAIPAADTFADPNPPSLQSTGGAWPITRQWTPAETKHYATWMEHFYLAKVNGDATQRMAKIEAVLLDPAMNRLADPVFLGEGANPELPRDIMRAAHSVLDCAKLTAFLPAYYAYRRGLPWMVTTVQTSGGDIRASAYNVPVRTTSNLERNSLSAFFSDVLSFNSGNYRVEIDGKNAGLSDSVPVALDSKYLIPGAPYYTDGHCLILGHITDYGEPYFLHASTTNSRDIYTYNGMNVVYGIPERGSNDPNDPWAGCFQGFRIFRYPIAETDGDGKVTGVRRRTDDEMRKFGYSTEQYEVAEELRNAQQSRTGGPQPKKLQDLLRMRLRSVDRIDPLRFMETYAKELLEVYELREEFVQQAWADVKRNGPITFPEEQRNANIFQAHGRWETWSSPSSDVDRRNKYHYLTEWLDYAIRWYEIAPEFVDLGGLRARHSIASQVDLMRALVAEKRRVFDATTFAYINSEGTRVPLSLSDVEKRLYDLSFDPNHPPELRWGAPEGSPERATAEERCTPVPDGTCVPMDEAYALQAYYRAVGQRSTEDTRLRGMFTEGVPRRDKLEPYLAFIWGNGAAPPRNTSVDVQPRVTPSSRRLMGQPVRTMRPVAR